MSKFLDSMIRNKIVLKNYRVLLALALLQCGMIMLITAMTDLGIALLQAL